MSASECDPWERFMARCARFGLSEEQAIRLAHEALTAVIVCEQTGGRRLPGRHLFENGDRGEAREPPSGK